MHYAPEFSDDPRISISFNLMLTSTDYLPEQ